MLIKFKTQDLDFQEDITDLLYQIDYKLAHLSRKKLNSIRYAGKVHINYSDFARLVKYRDLLEKKAKNSSCLKQYPLDTIIARIKQLLNTN